VKSAAASQPLPGKIAARLREAKWLALVAVAAYLALILATFDRADPGWSRI
jgi:S-DNA-T family DNA segregation ATPase FtsK/SpoIIIE